MECHVLAYQVDFVEECGAKNTQKKTSPRLNAVTPKEDSKNQSTGLSRESAPQLQIDGAVTPNVVEDSCVGRSTKLGHHGTRSHPETSN